MANMKLHNPKARAPLDFTHVIYPPYEQEDTQVVDIYEGDPSGTPTAAEQEDLEAYTQ